MPKSGLVYRLQANVLQLPTKAHSPVIGEIVSRVTPKGLRLPSGGQDCLTHLTGAQEGLYFLPKVFQRLEVALACIKLWGH